MAKSATRRYKVRLEDPNSDEFRITFLTAKSPEEARARCEQSEQRVVAYTLSDKAPEVAEGEEPKPSPLAIEEEKSEQRGRPTGRLVAHHQTEPYEVVDVVERGKG